MFFSGVTYATADVVIEPDADTVQTFHTKSGFSTVFIDDQTGYRFLKKIDNQCYYTKTTDGGVTWGSDTVITNLTDCGSISVWYDQWTPGDTGDFIHIVTLHQNGAREDVRYNRLDTTSDTLLLGSAPVVTTTGKTLTLNHGANKTNITKGTDGTLYMYTDDNLDSFVRQCSSSCNTTGGWSDAGTTPLDTQAGDHSILMPLSGGNIMLINRDRSANDIRSKIWNGTSWSASWTIVDPVATENATYDTGMSAMINPSNGRIHIAYVADNNNFTAADHDIRTAYFTGVSWTVGSDIITNDSRGLTHITLGIDKNTNDVYVGYVARATIGTATTGDVYWASSTEDMSSWSGEQGPINTTSDDIYGLDINAISDQRLFMSWFAITADEFLGDTILDTTPALSVSSIGSQITTTRASTSNLYLGGAFVLQEFESTRNVTNVTLSETGSVDGSADISNIRLLYESDTTLPYDCQSESYDGTEAQYGATDTNGFSGANGVASFAGSVPVATSSSLCVYVLLDVLNSADDSQTLAVEISNPSTDVVVTGGTPAQPETVVALSGDTTIVTQTLQQNAYHWRNDDGSETGATSATGGVEDTLLNGHTRGTPIRLRLGVANVGSTSTIDTVLRLEYGTASPTCGDVGVWTPVDGTDDAWNVFNSSNLTHGANTTDISEGDGGISNGATSFEASNSGVRDTTTQTDALVIGADSFVEYEFSLVASTTAAQGTTYCFRVTEGGVELDTYGSYPEVSIAADVNVSSIGLQIATADIGTSDIYAGGAFVITEGAASRDVSTITINETGSIDAANNLANIQLFYESDTTAPYDCTSESFAGTEAQFGSTVAGGFSAANGNASFSDSVTINPTSTLCVYVEYDITTGAQNSDEIEIEITSPNVDVDVSGGASVAPSTPIAIAGTTEATGAIVTQAHYHWRNDDGSETGATSATGGVEDTALFDVDKNEVYRLRVGLENTGGTTSVPTQFELQFGIKDTTCSVVASWTDVDAFANDSWDPFDTTFVTHGSDTTNISIGDGGVSNGSGTFLAANSAFRDLDAETPTTTLGSGDYVDLEFSITSTANTAFETGYCFRVVETNNPLVAYDIYPEVTTKVKRDYKIQRGTADVFGVSQTFTAGVDYEAPSSTSTAFVRVTNANGNGAGNLNSGNQNPDDVTMYLTNADDLTNSFTITRDTDSINSTRVSWEIIEFIGTPGTDNEMIVRDVNTINLGIGTSIATSSALTGVADDSDIVVFVTGSRMTNQTRADYSNTRVTAAWSSTTDQVVIERGTSDRLIDVSYAVVEFTGLNWNVQRVEHVYTAAGVAETEPITPVGAVTKAFVEAQKRMGDFSSVNSFGHEVYLSGMGTVSFYLDAQADTPSGHVSVAWIIENTQSGTGEMTVFNTNGLFAGGPEPGTTTVAFDLDGVNDTSNASLFSNATLNQATPGTNFPRPLAGMRLTSTTTYEVWRSDTGQTLRYRASVVEWPAADVAIRQNYYRWYDNDNALTPSDPWPPGGTDIGENTAITVLDTPVGDGDVIRLRTSYRITNGTLPANLQSFKLQYGLRSTTCSAVSTWNDVGAVGSGAVWRGFDNGAVADNAAVGTNPPTIGQTLLSVSDRAGRYVEGGVSTANPYSVLADEDVEYDWVIQHNGALQRSDYCFRTVLQDGTELAGYLQYPELRTEGYSPAQQSWRWYDDELSVNPTIDLAAEDTAPVEVEKGNTVKLRVTIAELNNLEQDNARFRLQFSDAADFSTVFDVVSSGACSGSSIWCYADGGGIDNATITQSVISTSDACTTGAEDGCGVHHESPLALTGYTHAPLAAAEQEFTIEYQNISGYYGQVWYFRVFDVANDEVVPLDSGATYPSLVGESGNITFTVEGLPSGTSTEGVVTDVTTTATSIPFGSLLVETPVLAAQRLVIDTNAISGYQVLSYVRQDLQNDKAETIASIAATNASPATWLAGCAGLDSCFGYHAGDDTLSGVTARFALDDTYAAASTTPQEIMYSAVPADEQEDIIYQLQVGGTQPPGDYTTDIVYVVVPQF